MGRGGENSTSTVSAATLAVARRRILGESVCASPRSTSGGPRMLELQSTGKVLRRPDISLLPSLSSASNGPRTSRSPPAKKTSGFATQRSWNTQDELMDHARHMMLARSGGWDLTSSHASFFSAGGPTMDVSTESDVTMAFPPPARGRTMFYLGPEGPLPDPIQPSAPSAPSPRKALQLRRAPPESSKPMLESRWEFQEHASTWAGAGTLWIPGRRHYEQTNHIKFES
mmetsp:Transcript_23620/g.76813  ORF Transcript_23620/g.76813 Transcript_23620/m.76813 type:complete len:228 (+) Transcript_23620:58-741(+)|eukprot:CAMPEP_0170135920 /NCGR_PEP_ID=MMETSP0033_2-20121228/2833_1 /TAXON_ID=195969 /ORGANISM="Dolichomastix tenuilepis, Strain CCMP3274" /LENGTH=227 /DNA_ID=CAMNT_0010371563 /DNA_START=53 /DNA_END=736 /DNA_ORIENTATION=-